MNTIRVGDERQSIQLLLPEEKSMFSCRSSEIDRQTDRQVYFWDSVDDEGDGVTGSTPTYIQHEHMEHTQTHVHIPATGRWYCCREDPINVSPLCAL